MTEADIEPLQRAGPRVLFGQKIRASFALVEDFTS
jgi:hypothetical protein